MFTLDSAVPRFKFTCLAKNSCDLALCCPGGIYYIENYGLSNMKRCFIPFDIEFRAITFVAPNNTSLIALSHDGKSIFKINLLETHFKTLINCDMKEHSKFTSIQIFSRDVLLIGTHSGHLLEFSLSENTVTNISKPSMDPVALICETLLIADSLGRLYSNNVLVFDDGILQPTALLHSTKLEHFYLVKHRAIYAFNDKTLKLSTSVSMDSKSGIFSSAAFDLNDNLLVATDSGRLYQIEHEGTKKISLKLLNGQKMEVESDGEDSSDEESDSNEKEANEGSKVANNSIFAICQNPNASEILVLKVAQEAKKAWLESISYDSSGYESEIIVAMPDFETLKIKITCPLCEDGNPQTVKLNAIECPRNQHPITICSQKKELISTKSFKCRHCFASYSTHQESCTYCLSLLTKIN